MKNLSLFSFLLFISFVSVAQSAIPDSIFPLQPINVVTSRLQDFSIGTKTLRFDSTNLQQHQFTNLASLFMDENTFFIKSYGNGTLATSSFRGGSASHTAILWNGFNLNSGLSGQIDLSLLPVAFADAVTVQYGATNTNWGSGAVGGAVHLNNIPKFDAGFQAKLGLSGGSFGQKNIDFQLAWSTKKWLSTLKLFTQNAKNDFPFYNDVLPNRPLVVQSHAAIKNTGLLVENHFKLSESQSINILGWLQKTEREIPPTMLQQRNVAIQNDENFRITSEWKQRKNRFSNAIRTAFFIENLAYQDSLSAIDAINKAQIFILEGESKYKINSKSELNIGTNVTHTLAEATNFWLKFLN